MRSVFFQLQQSLAYESRITKRVIVQQRDDTETSQETVIMFYYNPILREIDFSKTINEFFMACSTYPNLEYNNLKLCQVFYLDFSTKYFTFLGMYPFEKEVMIKYQDFQQDLIHIKYNPLSFYDEQIQSQPIIKQKKQRVRERSIKDALKLVGEWREIYKNKKVTLEIAAQQMGLPKKTLDDYYQQIRLAENHEFDFKSHLESGIGVMRKFVKARHEKKEFKELNIIQKFASRAQKKEEEMYQSSDEEEQEQQQDM